MSKLLQRMQVDTVPKQSQLTNLCYSFSKSDILLSIDVLEPQENSIFFHETSCKGGLTSRQACAIESAAIMHPNRQIYVLFNSPITNRSKLRKINEFRNVHVARIHSNYSAGTVLEDVMKKVYSLSRYPIAHTADVLRFLTLYKWSGIYLDLDTIVAKSLDQLGKNWAAKEDEHGFAVGAMAFASDDVGRSAILSVVEEIQQSYDPGLWSYNGNGVLARAFQRYCNVSKIIEISTPRCKGFQIHDPDVFFPVYWLDAQAYFAKGEQLAPEAQNAYIYHMWNQLTSILQIQDGSPYSMLAMTFCPKTYASFRKDFGYKSN